MKIIRGHECCWALMSDLLKKYKLKYSLFYIEPKISIDDSHFKVYNENDKYRYISEVSTCCKFSAIYQILKDEIDPKEV